jgi:enterochelin esterase-like enzyme
MRIIGLCSLILLGAALARAEKSSPESLIEMARTRSANLEPALRETYGEEALKKGTAFAVDHTDFLAAILTDATPNIRINQMPRVAASPQGGGLWIYVGQLRAGTAHSFTWIIDAQPFGGGNNIAAFGKDSYPQPGVPQGKLAGPVVMESKVYPGMKANVWWYVPAQWDGTTPLAVQIWGDGQFYVMRPSPYRVLDALDNLTHQKKIPLMANIFIQPGTGGPRPQMRSIEYDTVDDTYARYLLEDILPEIGKSVKLRQDGYSRAMVGESSGGICAFTAAYLKPDQFTRVLSWIGSFAALQVSAAHPAGGAEFPIMVRREPKKNIRVWLQDGAEDQENPRAGSWPLANIHLANSLKLKGYDYHFSFGPGTHSQSQGAAELPQSLIWLWREYDAALTTQEFTPEPGEKDKPLWRVVTLNRD